MSTAMRILKFVFWWTVILAVVSGIALIGFANWPWSDRAWYVICGALACLAIGQALDSHAKTTERRHRELVGALYRVETALKRLEAQGERGALEADLYRRNI